MYLDAEVANSGN